MERVVTRWSRIEILGRTVACFAIGRASWHARRPELFAISVLRARAGLSATDQLLQMFRVPGAVKRDRRRRALDGAKLVRRQFDGGRADVFLEAMQLRGSGDRNYPRLLRQELCERNLSRCRILATLCD